MVLVGELNPFPALVRGGVAPQIDGDVPYRAAHAAHELGLAGPGLEMEPTEDAPRRARVVFLEEGTVDPVLGPEVLPERLDQKAALVPVRRRLEEDEIGDLGFDPGDAHRS